MAIEDIPFALPFLGKEEEEAVLRVLRSSWLTTGREALAFEKEFADYLCAYSTMNIDKSLWDTVGTLNTVGMDKSLPCIGDTDKSLPEQVFTLAVNSATSGLHLALEALGIGPGDAVLVPSYTFTASAEVARYLGAEPILVDSLPGAFNIDPQRLEHTITRLEKGLPAYERPGSGGGGPAG
ncbi:MAG: aminotransferase class I/II-fold pyridoxal phosphate-dependent enzyme, partial [Spirochaetaceae bacterium]|nr:aminotransferase class I/II-fold pyridoxal phosphate-dependent enzyme [Spirochaetaceae bacterium]